MCDFSGRLVAWMDRELPDDEAADVGRHVRACTDCRRRVDVYEEVSRTLVAYCDAAIAKHTPRRLPRWVPALASACAAAVLLLVLRPAPVQWIPVPPPPVAVASPAIVVEAAPRPLKNIHRNHDTAPMKTSNGNWAVTEPTIRIAIPVDAMFPPGAVPEGITLIANLSVASDGSVQGLHPEQ